MPSSSGSTKLLVCNTYLGDRARLLLVAVRGRSNAV